ncbi:cellulose biosynthesis protein BcsS [Brevundimonas sp.]|uniref:cellulose biosynthesis protein BcsS n=1 Tax=Brevundimonas sp. TaxID=1871086 RepID=UPI002899A147|nr:cellulose biosynthesis protein BcsS [Brevundimonas sp.]
MTHQPRRFASKTSFIAAAAVLGAVSWSETAAAQSDVTVFAGGKLDVADSAYAGAAVGLPGSIDGKGWAVRGSIYTGGYEYESGSTTIDADFTGGQAELVYRYGSGATWGSVGAGYRYVDTDLSPADPGNRREGGQGEMIVSLDGGHVAGPWRVDWYGSYGFRLDDYDALVSLTHTVGSSGRIRAGLEVAADGDSNYSAYHIGPVVGFKMGEQAEFQISAGLSDGDDRSSDGYVRVGFYRSF